MPGEYQQCWRAVLQKSNNDGGSGGGAGRCAGGGNPRGRPFLSCTGRIRQVPSLFPVKYCIVCQENTVIFSPFLQTIHSNASLFLRRLRSFCTTKTLASIFLQDVETFFTRVSGQWKSGRLHDSGFCLNSCVCGSHLPWLGQGKT